MLTSVLLSFSAMLLSGDLSHNRGKIEGTKWASKAGTVKGTVIPEGVLKLEFAKDGKMTYGIAGTEYTGTYGVRGGDTVSWDFDKELGDTKRKRHIQKCVIKGDVMTVSDSDGTSLDFARVKK